MLDYKFYNANPLSKIEEDCVCRAICKATKKSYYSIKRKLKLIGELFECDALCVCCYHHLLEQVFGLKPKYANGQTVGKIAKDFKDNILIIRIQGHLTMSEFGTVYDIWDCTQEKVDVFWIVE